MPDEQSCNFVRRSRPQSHARGSVGACGLRSCFAAARGRPPARWRARFHCLVFTQGFYSADEALAIARAGHTAGCKEALFTLGDQPELRYRSAADELARLGHRTTLSYLAEVARAVYEQTGLLPHLNPGHLTLSDVAALRAVSLSQGLMLESASERLCERGGPHYGSPDKHPRARLASIRAAGEQRVPFTSGILIGIGETREERIDSLLALRALNDAYGHIQEII